MASAVAKAMLLAVLGFCAFSLQGCGEEETVDNSAAYATAAAGAGDGKAAKDIAEKGGCPPLAAAVTLAKDDFLAEVIPAISGSLACNSTDAAGSLNFTSAECKKIIVQKISDTVLYFAEADPGFANWSKTDGAWTKEAKGEVETELLAAFGSPSAALQSFIAAGVAAGDYTFGDEAFTEYLTTQVWQETTAVLSVFCPAPVESVAAAEAADVASVAAEKTEAAAEAVEKVEKAKEEAAAEGVDATGDTTAAPTTTVESTGRRLTDLVV